MKDAERSMMATQGSSKGAPPVKPATGPSWSNALLLTVFGGFCGLYGPYAVISGEFTVNAWWLWVALPVIEFLVLGLLLQGLAELQALITGQVEGFREGAVFRWWVRRVGLGLLIVFAGLSVIALTVLMLTSLYDGFSKGPAIIVFTLLFILFAVWQIAWRN